MAQIMNARASLSFGATKTALSQDLQKDTGERWMSVFGAAQINEERRSRGSRPAGSPTLARIASKLAGGGRGNGNITRFIELSLLNQEEAAFKIHLAQGQVQRLPNAEPGGVKQSNQGGNHGWAQGSWRADSPGSGHDFAHLATSVNVRSEASSAWRAAPWNNVS